jgi:hypothetical protein
MKQSMARAGTVCSAQADERWPPARPQRDELTDDKARMARAELMAVRWQLGALSSRRSAAPLEPRQELLYELLRLREKQLVRMAADQASAV